jgi:hypothetical protein
MCGCVYGCGNTSFWFQTHEASREHSALVAKATASDTRITALEQQLASTTAESVERSSTLARLQGKLEVVEQSLSTVSRDKEALIESNSTCKAQVEFATAECTRLRQQLTEETGPQQL